MLRSARMQKFRAVVLQRSHDRVVSRLHEAGVVQIKEISGLKVTRKTLGDEYYEVSSLLGKLYEMRDFLGEVPSAFPEVVGEFTYQQTMDSTKSLLEELGPKIEELKSSRKGMEDEKQTLQAQIEVLDEMVGINVPLRYLKSSDAVHVTAGRVASEKAESFLESARNTLSRKAFAAEVGLGKHRIVIVVCRARDKQKLFPLLYKFEVELIELPPIEGTPVQARDALRGKLDALGARETSIREKIQELKTNRGKDIACTAELLEIQKERLEGAAAFGYTEATTLIEGWVLAKRVQELDGLLNEATGQRCIFRTYDPKKSEVEEIPIELENPPIVKDFERLTEMYGRPKYDEVDPTPFLAITFPLFFAICLSDPGYGVLLGIFMVSGISVAKAFPRDLRVMLVLSAAVTVPIGLMMGGWFGFTEVGGLSIASWWVNPIESPIPILKLAVFIGIIHILVGLAVVAALKDTFRRNWKNLFLGNVPKILIVVGFFGLVFFALGLSLTDFGIAYTFSKMDLFEAFNPLSPAGTMVTIFRILLFTGLGVGMVGSVVLAKEFREKFSGPINVVYGITGFVADAASYARLMALGIATAIIAYAINFILGWMYGSLDFSGSIVSLMVAIPVIVVLILGFVIGHCFNLFINCLGAFIHTLRLHYVEFFGKFYEGGGEGFTPFKVKRTYTTLT